MGSGITEVKAPNRTPQANGACEKFMCSFRREFLEYILIHEGRYSERVVKEYTAYFDLERPRQGIDQRIPDHHELRQVLRFSWWDVFSPVVYAVPAISGFFFLPHLE
jgi:hypothetical protein